MRKHKAEMSRRENEWKQMEEEHAAVQLKSNVYEQ